MNCPLCTSVSSVMVRRSNLIDLRKNWLKFFGFDPFPANFLNKHIDKKRCATCHLEFYDPPLYGDDSFYEKISKHGWYYEQDKWEFEVAAESVSRLAPESLLEIGCGEGFFLEKILSLGVEADGVDINKYAIEICRAKGLNAEVKNIFDIKKSYDMVVLFEVLEHLENPKELINFIASRLIKPGGHLIIAVPNPDGYFKELGTILLDMPPHHNSGWGFKTFDYLSAQYGLKIVDYKKEPLRYIHYVGLLNQILLDNPTSLPISFVNKIIWKLRSIVISFFAPLTYLRDREIVDGQTHLVIFKKN